MSPLASVVTADAFVLERFAGTAATFHATDLLSAPAPRVVVCAAIDSALVLGSRQTPHLVDLDACRCAGVTVTKRRSGGGAVLVETGAMCWFDVVAPAGHPSFQAVAGDVGASMRWLGSHIAVALKQLGTNGVQAHNGPMTGGRWSQLVCFAGLGPGELSLDGRKLVGISQRRTRLGSRFQCMVHVRWAPDLLVELLAPPRPTAAELPPVAVLAADVADALPGAVVRALNAATG